MISLVDVMSASTFTVARRAPVESYRPMKFWPAVTPEAAALK
ncbi:hypothetical protein [Streptomyces sp. HUAS ZL42]